MYFINKEHEIRFTDICAEKRLINFKSGSIDREYGAAYYLLTSSAAIFGRCKGYLQDGIYFEEILRNSGFSSGEAVIVKLAWELFDSNGRSGFTVGDMMNSLDANTYFMCQQALNLRRLGFSEYVKSLQNKSEAV